MDANERYELDRFRADLERKYNDMWSQWLHQQGPRVNTREADRFRDHLTQLKYREFDEYEDKLHRRTQPGGYSTQRLIPLRDFKQEYPEFRGLDWADIENNTKPKRKKRTLPNKQLLALLKGRGNHGGR